MRGGGEGSGGDGEGGGGEGGGGEGGDGEGEGDGHSERGVCMPLSCDALLLTHSQ